MADLTREQIRAEADRLVEVALGRIEAAQRELDRACQALCPIIGGLQQYERVAKLHDGVDTRWHQLKEWARQRRGKLDLDEFGRGTLAKCLAAEGR